MQSLPIDSYLDSIVKLVESQSQVILTATPGAGKTTRLPAHLLKAVKGKVAVLQPRRLSAISACQYVCHENNWTLGKEAGYQVRLDSQFERNTRLLFMTDALLLRRLIDDPELKTFDLIVIDEFHERNLNQDLILGLIKELQDMGSPIKLLIMSATLNLSELKSFLPQSQIIDIPGKAFPLQINYSARPLNLKTDFEFIKAVTDAVILADKKTEGQILTFLPGKKEIQNVGQKLLEQNLHREVVFLHGSIPLNQQREALSYTSKKRVILATNIAEASVTVPGVDYVIDTGLSRILNTNLKSGFSKLDLVSISTFNADQRAGRAARQKPGICHRLWTTFDQQKLDTQMPPEVQRVDLSQTLLLLSHLGIRNFLDFSWLTPPSKALVDWSEFYLKSVGALNQDHTLSALGERLLAFPINPRWGSILAESEIYGETDLATSISCILQNENLLDLEIFYDPHCESDLLPRLHELKRVLKKGSSPPPSFKDILENKKQLESIIVSKNTHLPPDDHRSKDVDGNRIDADFSSTKSETLNFFLLHSQSDRLCRRRHSSDRALMVGGRGVRLAKSSNVKQSEYFIALHGRDNKGDPETLISLAHGITKETLLRILKDKIMEQESIIYDENKEQFFKRRVRVFYDLELEEPKLTMIDEKDLGDKFITLITKRWDYVVKNNSSLCFWMQRWHFFTAQEPQLQSILNDEVLSKVITESSYGISKMQDYLKLDLVYFIESQIPLDIVKEFKNTVPEMFYAPSGKSYKIQYGENEPPFVEVRIQELFGLTQTPKLGLSSLPLVFKLLAPNYRPVQVTSDIAGFWKNSYFDVRKELRSRYPKHPWPEDPLTAPPVKR